MLRFAGVGVLNTLIDTLLFLWLHDRIGIVAANFASTSAGMTFSFVVNGLVTFRAGRLTLRDGLLFLATTGATMWLIQPVVIYALLGLGLGVLLAKLLAIGACLGVNFVAYRFVVWPAAGRP